MSLSEPDDPTNFEGSYSTHHSDVESSNRKNPKSNAATGASAAGVRALSAQLVAFYFRAPAKAFFRTRVEYGTSSIIRRYIEDATNME